MKLAVSAGGNSLDATVDPRFGRCGYFIIVDTNDQSFQAFENANVVLQKRPVFRRPASWLLRVPGLS